MKKRIKIVVAVVLAISMLSGTGAGQVDAKEKKVKLSTKKVTMYKGKTKNIKLKNAGKKVKWKIKNKKIAKIVKKSGKNNNQVKIKGLKKGSTKIIATCGKKKFTAKIVVKANKVSTNINSNSNPNQNATEVETSTVASANEAKIVGKVTNTSFKYFGSVYFQYVLNGNTDDMYTYGMAPGKLEILENGVWRELKKKAVEVKAIAGIVSKDSMGYLDISLYDSYEGLNEGHYRYTHTFSGIEVPVEFDFKDEVNVVLENDKVKLDGSLNVTYSYEDKREFRCFTTAIGKLEIYENGQWTEMTRVTSDIIPPMTGGILVTEDTDSFVLKDKFENVRAGHYRYTVSITDMPVEFDVIE